MAPQQALYWSFLCLFPAQIPVCIEAALAVICKNADGVIAIVSCRLRKEILDHMWR